MIFSEKHRALVLEYLESRQLGIAEGAKVLSINQRTLSKWVKGECSSVRKPVWQKFVKNSGLDEILQKQASFELLVFKASKLDAGFSGTPYMGGNQKLKEISINHELNLDMDESFASSLVVIDQLDDSLFQFFKPKDKILIEPLATPYENNNNGFNTIFSKGDELIVGTLNGRFTHKILSVVKRVIKLKTCDGFEKELHDNDQLNVHGRVIGKVIIQSLVPLIVFLLTFGSLAIFELKKENYNLTVQGLEQSSWRELDLNAIKLLDSLIELEPSLIKRVDLREIRKLYVTRLRS